MLVSNSKEEKEDNFAPALAAAGRALIATMMAKVASLGFNDVTPAFSSLMPLLDATGARPSTLAQRAGTSAEVRLELQSVALAKLGKSRVSRLRRDLTDLAAALEELRTR